MPIQNSPVGWSLVVNHDFNFRPVPADDIVDGLRDVQNIEEADSASGI